MTTYCYWSVCDGPYGAIMENCVRTARAAGVFKEFHVLCDRPLEGCHCYDAFQLDKSDGLFKLHYLKVGASRLPFDFLVWLDADSVFVRNPLDLLGAMGRSPLHVPLEYDLSALQGDPVWEGVPCRKLRDYFQRGGIVNRPYVSGSAFWIVKRKAIDQVYDLALEFWNGRAEAGLQLNVNAALGYAMQILCANPEAHLLASRPDLWASACHSESTQGALSGLSWDWKHPLAADSVLVRPAIVHVPMRGTSGAKGPQAQTTLQRSRW